METTDRQYRHDSISGGSAMRRIHDGAPDRLNSIVVGDDLQFYLVAQPITRKEIRMPAKSLDFDDGQSSDADTDEPLLYRFQCVTPHDCYHIAQSHDSPPNSNFQSTTWRHT